MKIFKFGGASVSSADAIRNAASIIELFPDQKVIVISAMGNTTNELEDLVKSFFKRGNRTDAIYEKIKEYHAGIIAGLDLTDEDLVLVEQLFNDLKKRLQGIPSLNFDYEYDQLICYGELISTAIISAYLNKRGLTNRWIDIRQSLRTDETHREAVVDWKWSGMLINNSFNFQEADLYVTQGFIGSTNTNQTTTLGREGSDFTAAILGNLLNAESVTIWKNVPGVLNADPVDFDDTVKLEELSYKEAIELAYSGAKVIHPKTIKPLRNKRIPLLVRPFDAPDQAGTMIHDVDYQLDLVPVFILKKSQALVTISPSDFSFIGIDQLSEVFSLFRARRIKVNLIQQSAIDLSLCIDEPEIGLESLIVELRKTFEVRYNTGLILATIRFYNDDALCKMKAKRQLFLEQRSRRTARLVLK
ncbi:aspartate kinase [Sunxiuqinia elliptica]|uniref:Aspartokinase n=1 Tax=Sunxiuqinia elliptica TaxID=655355 RepID=A0A4R6H8L0_9BACT|nr:aspartate kinase [Sunxiuqinia elliptica]TDO03961.1 aspartate kinase [Sunxiuqinia elliptica]TDO62243.1 aspartate kinase [Sunxiuqinia elliptica]